MKFVIIAVTLLSSLHSYALDFPPVWLCQESHGGALVLDGGKQAVVTTDRVGRYYFSAIQRDQFSGNSVLVKNLEVAQVKCDGFVPCELYQHSGMSLRFFINVLPQGSEGHLKMKLHSSPVEASFRCKRNLL